MGRSTIGPRLKDGNYVMVSGTDNDYSVTQNASGQQFEAYFASLTKNECRILYHS